MSTIGEQPEPPRQDADEETGRSNRRRGSTTRKAPFPGPFQYRGQDLNLRPPGYETTVATSDDASARTTYLRARIRESRELA